MKINYPIHAQNDIGLTPISAHQASEKISKYNVYFKLHCIPTDEYVYNKFDFDSLDNRIYKLDNYRNFDKQYYELKTILLGYDSRIRFYTDNKEDSEMVENRLLLAHYILIKRCKTINTSNLKKITKLNKDDVSNYVDSLEKNKTASLFEN